SNSSSASQQPVSYPSSAMANGPTTTGYPQQPSSSYNTSGNVNDSTNNTMNSSGHTYMDQQYSNIPPPNYGYPPQQMNPYVNHPAQMHGQPTNEFRPPPMQSMEDDTNAYRNKPSLGMMIDQQQQQQQSHHPPLLPSS
ncbi:unnamed protein product, partial [Rotaria sp. Silwood1]